MKKVTLSPKIFFNEYKLKLEETLNNINLDAIEKIYKILNEVIKKNNYIYVIGNGGAASISNHFLCDFNKGIKFSSNNRLIPKIHSLSNSTELITAISNDINFNKIFSFQLENFAKNGDCLFAFSCSGTSKNILNAIKFCNKKNIKIIFITGFLEKKLKYKTDIHINLKCKNYGICEDVFSSIMHMISQYIRVKFKKKEIL